MTRHSGFTIIADIKDDHEDDLRCVLAALDIHAALSPLTMVHFASFVVFNKDKLKLDRSKLVFECVIDGAPQPFIEALDKTLLDNVYYHCEGYDTHKDIADKRRYLTCRVRWPQLFHVGTPYRSAASIQRDQTLRETLDSQLFKLTSALLPQQLATPAAGQCEYWNWELLKPWLAWIIGLTAACLMPWVIAHTRWAVHWAGDVWTAVWIALFQALGALIGVAVPPWLWLTTPPELRERVKPWVYWTIAGLLTSGVVAFVLLRHADVYWWAFAIAAVFVAALAYNIHAAIMQRQNQRLEAIRPADVTMSIVAAWKRLLPNGFKGSERPQFLWVWNMKWWGVVWLVIFLPLYYWAERYRWETFVAVVVLFFLEGLWLGALVGWPSGAGSAPAGKGTRGLFTQGGFWVPTLVGLVIGGLVWIRCGPAVLAALVLAAMLALWSVPIQEPEVDPSPMDRQNWAELLNAEDYGVQNHMAAVVPLKTDRWWRAIVLKSFLWPLSFLFYRAVLPDLYRGKLFGLSSVHFAQWVLLDKRNFLFLSNYDHSWTSYLDDFGIELNTGIRKLWGQGEGNPGTSNLPRFKDFARSTMVLHSRWYTAYPDLTVRQIWNNENIRRGLTGGAGEEAMVKTLRRLGAAPKTLTDLFHVRVN